MIITFHKEKLQKSLLDFQVITGITVGVYDAAFKSIELPHKSSCQFCEQVQGCEEGKLRCIQSDRRLLEQCRASGQAETHICHAGLIDTVMPIKKDEQLVGYLIFGQRIDRNQLTEFENILARVSDLKLDHSELKNNYGQIQAYKQSWVTSAHNLALMFSRHISFDNIVTLHSAPQLEQVVDYIHCNLQQPLSLGLLCSRFHLSKNTLYKHFRLFYNCTVNEYITKQRIAKACLLLKTTDHPVYEISAAVGMENYSYFCRLFKKTMGITPFQYHKGWLSREDSAIFDV